MNLQALSGPEHAQLTPSNFEGLHPTLAHPTAHLPHMQAKFPMVLEL